MGAIAAGGRLPLERSAKAHDDHDAAASDRRA
jgi:hypothetical protein